MTNSLAGINPIRKFFQWLIFGKYLPFYYQGQVNELEFKIKQEIREIDLATMNIPYWFKEIDHRLDACETQLLIHTLKSFHFKDEVKKGEIPDFAKREE